MAVNLSPGSSGLAQDQRREGVWPGRSLSAWALGWEIEVPLSMSTGRKCHWWFSHGVGPAVLGWVASGEPSIQTLKDLG